MSNVLKTTTFEHEGKSYEIRIMETTAEVVVRAYQGNRPANGYTYGISYETLGGLSVTESNAKALGNLVQMAKDDVVNNCWERLIQALAEA